MNPANASFTNANNYAMSCVLDGITAPCGQVMRAVNNGTVNPNSITLSTTGGAADFANAGLGGLVIDLSNPQKIWKEDQVISAVPPKLHPRNGTRTPLTDDPKGGEANGHWETYYEVSAFFHAAFVGGTQAPENPGPCELMARFADAEARFVLEDVHHDIRKALLEFDKRFAAFYLGRTSSGEGRPMRTFGDVLHYMKGGGTKNRLATGERLGQSDFREEFYEQSTKGDAEDQTHHFAAYFSLGINDRPISEFSAKALDRVGGEPDRRLGERAYELGQSLRNESLSGRVAFLQDIGNLINIRICR